MSPWCGVFVIFGCNIVPNDELFLNLAKLKKKIASKFQKSRIKKITRFL
jgi:hypothetical protein